MRLVAWNANANNRRARSFEATVELLQVFHPDVLVISETGLPSKSRPNVFALGESGPALVVLAMNGYSLNPSPLNEGAPIQSGTFEVIGPAKFRLAAVWPVKRPGGPTYAPLLRKMVGHFAAELSGERVVMAGDFNSSPTVSGQAKSHPALVSTLREVGLESAYHHHSGEVHGLESIGTYRHGKSRPMQFHIDYCFVSRGLVDASTLTIPRSSKWQHASDHVPLILDIPDSALHKPTTAKRRLP